MSKLFKRRVTTVGKEALSEALEVVTELRRRTEATYGADSIETANCVLMMGFIHYLDEAFEQAEPIFQSHVETIARQLGTESVEYYSGLHHLISTYISTTNFPKIESFSERWLGSVDMKDETPLPQGPTDPLIESLYDLAVVHNTRGDAFGRRVGFVLAVMALSHCVSRYRQGGVPRKQAMARLRSFVMSLGIDRYDYAWLVRCSDHDENDFVGLLSVIDEEGVFPLRH